MDERMVIGFTGKIVPKKPVNDQLTLCKCYVMAIGENQNKTNISKEASDNALPSLFNVPVVGHIYIDKDNICHMGGHDMTLDKDEEGNYKFKVLTVPYGVVPSQDNVHYEEVEESNGNTKTYLVADVILWTGRFPELLSAKYNDEVYYGQSMEINPIKTRRNGEILDIEEYQYSALCLLGKSDNKEGNVEPCFEQARVEPYAFSADETFCQLLDEFKEELSWCYERQSVEDTEEVIPPDEDKGDNENAEGEENDALLEQTETVDNPQVTGEEIEDEGDNGENDQKEEESLKYSVELTYEEMRIALSEALEHEFVWNEIEYSSYCLMDFDSQFAYCLYRHCSEGGEVKQTVRIPYEINDGLCLMHYQEQENVRLVWLTKEDEEKIANDKAKLDELTEYKKVRTEDDRRKEFGAIINDFRDLGEVDDYREVVKNAMTFENAEALREKLYAIRGKYLKPAAKKPIAQIRIPVGFDANKTNTELDEFMSKYLPSKNKK